MKTQTDYALVDRELDAVVGGRMNIPRSDFHTQNGVPGSGGKGNGLFDALFGFSAATVGAIIISVIANGGSIP